MQKLKKLKFKIGDIVWETRKKKLWNITNIGYNGQHRYQEYMIQEYGTNSSRPFPALSVDNLCKKATKAQIVLYAKNKI